VSSGSGFLYSAEYFEQVRSRLKPGGLMAQWNATPRVGNTFVSVFPYVLDFGNWVLIGSNDPIPFDMDRVKERLESPEISTYLTLGNIDPDHFLHLLQTRWPLVKSWTPETPRENKDINTDFWPKDEYYLNN
jgi:spermidine synthase